MSFLQLGHGWSCTCTNARCEGRRPFLDLDSLTFGRARAAEFYRSWLLGGRFAALVRLRLTRLQRLDTTAHRRERTPEVRLELLQLLQCVGLGLPDDVIGLRLGVLDDLRPVAFGAAKDLMVGRGLLSPLIRARHDAGGFGVRLRDDALLLR